jgi:flagellar basal-body rod modification protein FlgD
MTIPATTSTTASSSTSSAASTTGQAGLNTDYNSFLKLLTTQLQNQDPLSPMDDNTFTQQLVEMNGVQQQIQTNTLLQTLVNQSAGAADAVNLIGKTVQATSASATLNNGSASWQYSLASNASAATVEVLDASNTVIYSAAAPSLSQGSNTFNWNGQTSSGGKVTSGTYTLKIVANDSKLQPITSTISVSGVVTGVQSVGGATQLNLGSTTVPYSSLTQVTNTTN